MSAQKKVNQKVVEAVEDDDAEAPATFADLYAGKFAAEGGRSQQNEDIRTASRALGEIIG
jgi:hypothetical protein